jgi:uncharacterized protein
LKDESPLGFGSIGEREDFRPQERWESHEETENGWRRGMPSLPISISGIILVACIAIYLLSLVAPSFVYGYLALNPAYLLQRPWTLVTYMFVHASFDHLFWNMLFLFFFGIELERRVGEKTFLVIYLLSGITAALVQILVFPSILVGASGALFGIMGCLAVIAPEIRVLIFFVIPLSIRAAIVLFALVEFLSFGAADNIAHMAHIAGLLVGVAFGYAMMKQPKYNYNI